MKSENMFRVTGKQEVTVELSQKDFGRELIRIACEMCGNPDDAGCDWYTHEGNTYIGELWGWQVSNNPAVASLVDAGNFLLYGEFLKMPSKLDAGNENS